MTFLPIQAIPHHRGEPPLVAFSVLRSDTTHISASKILYIHFYKSTSRRFGPNMSYPLRFNVALYFYRRYNRIQIYIN